MKKCLWLPVAILVLASLPACGPREHCGESHDSKYTRTLKICTDKETYDCGEPIHITFTITNVSSEDLVLDGGDEPALDIFFYVEGYEVSWSDGQDHTSDLTVVTLAPRETRTISWVWPVSEEEWETLGCADRPIWDALHIGVDAIVRHVPGELGAGPYVNIRYRGGVE